MADELESQHGAEVKNEQPDAVEVNSGEAAPGELHPDPNAEVVVNHVSPQEHNIVGQLDHSTFPPTVKTPEVGTYNHVMSGADEVTTAEIAKPANIALLKTSGDEKDAGDWTKSGNGTAYPETV